MTSNFLFEEIIYRIRTLRKILKFNNKSMAQRLKSHKSKVNFLTKKQQQKSSTLTLLPVINVHVVVHSQWFVK